MNQSLVINILSLINGVVIGRVLGLIPVVGGIVSWVISIIIFVLWILGLAAAITQEKKAVPFVGQIKILK